MLNPPLSEPCTHHCHGKAIATIKPLRIHNPAQRAGHPASFDSGLATSGIKGDAGYGSADGDPREAQPTVMHPGMIADRSPGVRGRGSSDPPRDPRP